MTLSFVHPETRGPARTLALDLQPGLIAAVGEGIIEEAGFAQLDAGLLARVLPDRVLLPLLSVGHDAMAVVERLEQLGYRGQITVIAPSLPRARMVEQELQALGPGMRLTLLTPAP